MQHHNDAKPATEETVNGLRDSERAGEQLGNPATPIKSQLQGRVVTAELGGSDNVGADMLKAKLADSDHAGAAGLSVIGSTPVLELCRLLVGAGHDPNRPLHVYRGNTLALRVRSIGAGAALTVKTAGNGTLIFALVRGATAPPIRWRDDTLAGATPTKVAGISATVANTIEIATTNPGIAGISAGMAANTEIATATTRLGR